MKPCWEPGASQLPFSNGSHCIELDNWELRETVLPTLHDVPVSEALFTVGNGFMGVRGYAEEAGIGASADYYRTNEGGRSSSHNGSTSESGGRRPPALVDSHVVVPVIGTSQCSHATNPSSPVNSHESVRGTYIAGFSEQRLLTNNRNRSFAIGSCSKECFLVRVPDAFSIDVFVAGEHVSASTGFVTSHTRRLDLRTGELRRRMVWESFTHPGREVLIESTRFASTVRKSIGVVRYAVSARNVTNTDIRIVSRIDVPDDAKSRRSCGVENAFTRYNIQEASSVVLVRTRNSCRHLAVATVDTCCSMPQTESTLKQFASGSVTSLGSSVSGGAAEANFMTSPGLGGVSPGVFPSSATSSAPSPTSLAPKSSETECGTETTFTSCISERITIELTKFIGFFGDDDAPQEDLCEMGMQRVQEASRLGFDAIVQEHRYAMNRFWETADIRYKGSQAMQGAFRFNMLQIIMSVGTSSNYGFPTRGLTGENMGGGHQWDVDIFVIPTLIHSSPEIARALLQFRINTLSQAKNLANDLDLPRGAIYPYRTINGTDNPTPYCAAFLFVNATIAYAMRLYVSATNDYSILADGGAEVILATALVWLEWGTWDKGVFRLRSVSGPDIYNGAVDDNFFTNIMAQEHMLWMVEIANHFRVQWLIRWNEILEHCSATEDDIDEMEKAAAKMYLPFDGERRVHPADKSFMLRKEWKFEDLKVFQGESIMHRYHPNVIYRHQLCRIPDVLLAIVLMPERFSMDEMRADFEFYEAITSSDSALRRVINSVVAARLRMEDKAMENFSEAIFVDLYNTIGNTGGGLHCTTAAGAVWALAAGFAGMQVVQGVLHFHPTLPEGCDEYQFHARHNGCLVRVLVNYRMATYTMLESSNPKVQELALVHDALRLTLRKGIPETVRLHRKTHLYDFECVIFDLDSILVDIEDFHYEAWKTTLEQFFHETEFPDFVMTKELYLAYLRHAKPISGLLEIFKRFNRQPLPTGDLTDSNRVHSLNGLCSSKLQCFRQCVQRQGLHLREGCLDFLTNLKYSGMAVGCVTGSKNGRWLFDETPHLHQLFDDFMDGNDGEEAGLRWRPEMDYFETIANRMNCAPGRTVVVVDGTDGFSKGSIEHFCMLVDVSAEPENVVFDMPRLNTRSFQEVRLDVLDDYTSRAWSQHRDPSGHRRRHRVHSTADSNNNIYTSPTSTSQPFPEGHSTMYGGGTAT